jgi:hypothetical protein
VHSGSVSLAGVGEFQKQNTGDRVMFLMMQKSWNRHLHVSNFLPTVSARATCMVTMSANACVVALFGIVSVLMHVSPCPAGETVPPTAGLSSLSIGKAS